MRRHILVTAVLLVSGLFAAPAFGFYDGNETSINKYPFVASILVGDRAASTLWCTGVIVSKSWVLTTGTCAWIYPRLDLLIVVGSSAGQVGTGEVYDVAQIVWHPKLNPDVYYYQYGLIQIQGSFKWSKTVQKVKLPTKDIKLGTEMTVVGFGFQDSADSDLLAFNLKEGSMKWIASNKCVHNDSQLADIPQKKTLVCAYNQGKTTLCTCDWGAAYVKDGVVYGQFIEGDKSDFDATYCTSQAHPEAVSVIKPAVSWIKSITGAQTDLE